MSRVCASAIGVTIAASCVSFLLVLFDNKKFPLLTFLYWLSWVKMGVTFFKYMPQVRMHADFINSALHDVVDLYAALLLSWLAGKQLVAAVLFAAASNPIVCQCEEGL